MPGVLIVEAMAQTAAVVRGRVAGWTAAGKLVYFMSIDGAKFRKPVLPGTHGMPACRKVADAARFGKFKGEARVDGALMAEATFTAMIMDDDARYPPDRHRRSGAEVVKRFHRSRILVVAGRRPRDDVPAASRMPWSPAYRGRRRDARSFRSRRSGTVPQDLKYRAGEPSRLEIGEQPRSAST